MYLETDYCIASNEYTQIMFIWRIDKNYPSVNTKYLLIKPLIFRSDFVTESVVHLQCNSEFMCVYDIRYLSDI